MKMPDKSIAVFLGPSLSWSKASQILDANYYPPAKKGDLYKIISSGVKIIVLIDGTFHTTFSVWHRELLSAIDEGITVIGASSMGALRASELHEFGMIGQGVIFKWFQSGFIESDDEVALLHESEETNFKPISEPLVNIRYTLLKAVKKDIISFEFYEYLINQLKQLYYPKRSYRELLKLISIKLSREDTEKLRKYFETERINLKEIDTIQALNYSKSIKKQIPKIDFYFSRKDTCWKHSQILLSTFRNPGDTIDGMDLIKEVKKDHQLLEELWIVTSKQWFLLDWAKQNNVLCSTKEIEDFIAHWQLKYCIHPDNNWLQQSGLTQVDFYKLLAERALINFITQKGPNHFNLPCNFRQLLHEEMLIKGYLLFSINQPLANQKSSKNSGVESINLTQSKFWSNWFNTLDEMWFELSQTQFILAWAAQNGILYPVHEASSCLKRFEQKHNIKDREQFLQDKGIQLNQYISLIEKRSFIKWLLKKGPSYFGFNWRFDVALLEELKITGKALQIIKSLNK